MKEQSGERSGKPAHILRVLAIRFHWSGKKGLLIS